MCQPENATYPTMTSVDKKKMIPSIGIGTFNSFQDHEKVYEAVKFAIQNGYRLIDCSPLYGNETQVGKAIQESINNGIVKREDLFVTSKLWNTEHDPQDVEPACRRTLKSLGLDYLDLFMMHWPVQMTKDSKVISGKDGGEFRFKIVHSGDREKLAATYNAMENLVDMGLVKDLGVSNFSTRQLEELLQDCTIKPIANEVEMHPFLQQTRLFHYCVEREIRVIGYSPLGKIGYREPSEPDLLATPEIVQIAEETGKTPSQVVLAWAVQRGGIAIPKSLNPERIIANFDVQDGFLSGQQMDIINALDRAFRYVRVPYYDFPDDPVDLSLTQPKATEGKIDESNVYRNVFERAGRPLKSNIIIESGAIRKLKSRAREYVPKKCHGAKNYIVTDQIVNDLYGDAVLQGFKDAGLETYKIVVPSDAMDESGNPSTEYHKTLAVFSSCCDKILESGISKNSCIISLGGGVVNNLCGFLASSLYRGITLVHITTSMMGMTDAAIDFKQAVNHQLGKNLLGSYYPATNIVIDPEVLKTLTKRHILNGIAEALKHALCQSRRMTEAIVHPLDQNIHKALEDSPFIEMVCRECIDHKVPTLTHYAESDFNEMVPQYGHAIAHSIEHLSYHTNGRVLPLLHGEAVAIGMCVTAEVAKILGICSQKTVDEHYEYISQAGLPVFVPQGLELDAIMKKMQYDKHFVKKQAMGLAREIGHMHCNDDGTYAVLVDMDTISAALQANLDRRAKSPAPRDLYSIDSRSKSLSPTTTATNLSEMMTFTKPEKFMYGCDCENYSAGVFIDYDSP